MYASAEKKILKKNYEDHINYESHNLWCYKDKCDYKKQILFRWDSERKKYFFSFPMNESNYNYGLWFDTHWEATDYITYILNNYLE